jgi:pantothenate kinase type III
VFDGCLATVEGLINTMNVALGGQGRVMATGTLARTIAPETPLSQHVDAALALHGFRVASERNQ